MAEIDDAIFSLLSNDAPVAALLGTNIFPDVTPQETQAPFMIFQTQTRPTKIKNSVSPLDLIDVDMVVFSKTKPNANAIKAAIRSVLDRYSGTVASNNIDKINYEDDRTLFDEESDLYRADLRYSIRQKL